jgi:hypothetical protein
MTQPTPAQPSGEGPAAATRATVSFHDPEATRTYQPDAEATPSQQGEGKPPTVGDYGIESLLGRGGMGIVYRARQVKLNRPVALKMILPAGDADAAERARFKAAAEAVARLQLPNVMQIHEVGGRNALAVLVIEERQRRLAPDVLSLHTRALSEFGLGALPRVLTTCREILRRAPGDRLATDLQEAARRAIKQLEAARAAPPRPSDP